MYDSVVTGLRSPAAQTMKRKPIPILWMGMAFGVGLCLAAVVLAIEGIDVNSLKMALRVTARWSFLLFWVAYAGRAMATLFGPAFAPLARRGREFGLAYAAAMLTHVGLLIWIFELTSRAPLSGNSLLFFGTGIVFTYLLALFSFGRLAEALGPTGWLILRIVGVNYILYAFASDFVTPVIRSWACAARSLALGRVCAVRCDERCRAPSCPRGCSASSARSEVQSCAAWAYRRLKRIDGRAMTRRKFF